MDKEKKSRTMKKNGKKGKKQEKLPRGNWIGGAHLYEPEQKNLKNNP